MVTARCDLHKRMSARDWLRRKTEGGAGGPALPRAIRSPAVGRAGFIQRAAMLQADSNGLPRPGCRCQLYGRSGCLTFGERYGRRAPEEERIIVAPYFY